VAIPVPLLRPVTNASNNESSKASFPLPLPTADDDERDDAEDDDEEEESLVAFSLISNISESPLEAVSCESCDFSVFKARRNAA